MFENGNGKAVVHSLRLQLDELLGMGHRKTAQYLFVDRTEDSGVARDPECNRQHGNHGERRSAPQCPKRVSKIASHIQKGLSRAALGYQKALTVPVARCSQTTHSTRLQSMLKGFRKIRMCAAGNTCSQVNSAELTPRA